ncbi:hypothetical protein [Salinisphaera sp.]|uniref:hypothetical protein n=1 Tax=Salinisphaera sp. TaxID=1914330 RepID=UPI000C598B54|nr:hypothetical protein [Salinisphaera sp.]MAS10316.1 hypothetical protein [Salinisphaera sp.]|tara:strand:+ start:3330 stop:3551 length:222 start_codon:yes stop_codon:yes gene_type:complete
MSVEDRVPKSLVNLPGDGLNTARQLLEVVAALTSVEVDLKTETDYEMGVFHIVQLAQHLIEYEQAYPKGGARP